MINLRQQLASTCDHSNSINLDEENPRLVCPECEARIEIAKKWALECMGKVDEVIHYWKIIDRIEESTK